MKQGYMKKLDSKELAGRCIHASPLAYSLLISAGFKTSGIGFERIEDDCFPWSFFNIHTDGTFTNGSAEAGYIVMYERKDGFYAKDSSFTGNGFTLEARAKRLDNDEWFVGEYCSEIKHNSDRSESINHYIKQENRDKYYSDFTTREVDPTTLEYAIGDMWISAEVLKNTIAKAVA